LRLYVEVLGGALAPVLEGRASFAIVGDPALGRPKIASERITSVELVVVAAPKHPLASIEGKIPHEALKRHVQLVLTERTSTVSVNDHNVISAQTWRLADFFAKHKFLLMGLGWGAIPRHAVEEDIASGRLKVLSIEDSSQTSFLASMSAVYRVDAPPGPAARWLIERLKSGSAA
jgi:DNA-binding transcriptional LysR family regulator